MTKPTKLHPEKSFVASKLPWILAAAALLIYLLTLNHWVSLNNLSNVARSSGWTWGPEVYNPVFYLLTLPIRWLPASLIPIGFNVFSAVCGALSLGLLARCVALLPHDRTHDQRVREKTAHALFSGTFAWIPPVFAVLVCGFNLTFWENATAGASDMLDLLLLACVVRGLLEFRVTQKDSWLFGSALICGAGMANNWVMFVLFPAFVVALIWMKRMEFFNARFLLRLFLCGVIGTLFYLLLPTITALSHQSVSFWDALKMNLATDKQALLFFYHRAPITVRVLLLVTSLLPLLVISIRWSSNFGDPSKMGSSITSLIFHLAHIALLLLFLWIALDPKFSLRRKGFSISALPFLGSIVIGYITGYFLLVFRPLPDRMGRTSSMQLLANRVSFAAILILLVLMPLGLLIWNFPQVHLTNGPAVREYASQLVKNIPDGGVVLSDDSRKLYLAQAELTREGKAANHFFVDTQMLTVPAYHEFQKKRHADWPSLVDTTRQDEVKAGALLRIVFKLSETKPLSYLHPSFGYYFEVFDQRADGLSFNLTRYPTNSLSGPPLSDNEIQQNEAFWKQHESALNRLTPFIAAPQLTTNVTFGEVLKSKLKIPFLPNATATMLGAFYSQTLDFWGVQLQRANRLTEARDHFQAALDLFPENLAAKSNLALNRELKAGHEAELRPLQSLEAELGKYRAIDQMLRETGPFDDPTHCFALGLTFAQGNNFRQAAQQLERVHTLVPDNLQASFWLSRLYVMNSQPQKAISLLADLRQHPEELLATGIRKIDLLQAEAGALYVSGKTTEADQLVRDTLQKNLNDPQTLATIVQISAVFKRYTNALAAVDQLLKVKPNDVSALISKGVFSIQAGKPAEAVEPLSQAVSLQSTNYGARLYRAVAYMGSDQLDAAQQDYETLQKAFPNSNEVNSGLGEIAWRRKDTNAAVHYYELCLKNLPVESKQAQFFADRINSLKAGSP